MKSQNPKIFDIGVLSLVAISTFFIGACGRNLNNGGFQAKKRLDPLIVLTGGKPKGPVDQTLTEEQKAQLVRQMAGQLMEFSEQDYNDVQKMNQEFPESAADTILSSSIKLNRIEGKQEENTNPTQLRMSGASVVKWNGGELKEFEFEQDFQVNEKSVKIINQEGPEFIFACREGCHKTILVIKVGNQKAAFLFEKNKESDDGVLISSSLGSKYQTMADAIAQLNNSASAVRTPPPPPTKGGVVLNEEESERVDERTLGGDDPTSPSSGTSATTVTQLPATDVTNSAGGGVTGGTPTSTTPVTPQVVPSVPSSEISEPPPSDAPTTNEGSPKETTPPHPSTTTPATTKEETTTPVPATPSSADLSGSSDEHTTPPAKEPKKSPPETDSPKADITPVSGNASTARRTALKDSAHPEAKIETKIEYTGKIETKFTFLTQKTWGKLTSQEKNDILDITTYDLSKMSKSIGDLDRTAADYLYVLVRNSNVSEATKDQAKNTVKDYLNTLVMNVPFFQIYLDESNKKLLIEAAVTDGKGFKFYTLDSLTVQNSLSVSDESKIKGKSSINTILTDIDTDKSKIQLHLDLKCDQTLKCRKVFVNMQFGENKDVGKGVEFITKNGGVFEFEADVNDNNSSASQSANLVPFKMTYTTSGKGWSKEQFDLIFKSHNCLVESQGDAEKKGTCQEQFELNLTRAYIGLYKSLNIK